MKGPVKIFTSEKIQKYFFSMHTQEGPYFYILEDKGNAYYRVRLVTYEGEGYDCLLKKNLFSKEERLKIQNELPEGKKLKKIKIENPDNPFF